MGFDHNKTMVLLNVYPDLQVNLPLVSWLLRHRLLREDETWDDAHVKWYCQKGFTLAMNRAVKEIALKAPPEIDTFLFVEKDIRPDLKGGMTDAILTTDGDVVAVRYETANDRGAWSSAHAMHTGMFKVRRAVLEAMAPGPWFMERYSADGTTMEACNCMGFAEKVIAAGFKIVRAGRAWHNVKE